MIIGILAILLAVHFIRTYRRERDVTSLFFLPLIALGWVMYNFYGEMDSRIILALTIIFIFCGIYILYREYEKYSREKRAFIEERKQARYSLDPEEADTERITIEYASRSQRDLETNEKADDEENR